MPKEKKAVLKIKSKAKPATRPKTIKEVEVLAADQKQEKVVLSQENTVVKLKEITKEQELFCQYYCTQEFFANGVQSYAEAYQIDLTKKGAYKSALNCASRLLQDVGICWRINELLDLSGLSDEFVDKQMAFLITQNADLTNKLNAMKMYNDLRGRIVKKLEMTGNLQHGGAIQVQFINAKK